MADRAPTSLVTDCPAAAPLNQTGGMSPRAATTATARASGSAGAALAWKRYVTPELWPSWSPPIRSVDYSYETLRPDTGGVVHTYAGLLVPFHVGSVDHEALTWDWRAQAAGITLDLVHTVRAQGSGSSTLLEVTGPAVLTPLYARFATLALRRLVTP